MKKRFLSLLLAAGFCLSATGVSAVTVSELTATRNANKITVSGKVTDGAREIMVKVYNSTHYTETNKDGFVKLTSLAPDKNGNFSFDVIIPETLPNGQKSTGEYTVVYADGEANKTQVFSYSNTEDANGIYSTLKTATAEELYTNLQTTEFLEKAESVGVDTDTYSSLNTEQKNAALAMAAAGADKGNTDELVKDFNTCINAVYLTSCSEENRVITAKKANLDYNGTTFDSLSEADKKTVADYMAQQTYSELADADKYFSESVSIIRVSSARKDNLTDVFTQNATAIGMTSNVKYQSYLILPETQKLQINERFVLAMETKGDITSTNEIIMLFSSAYDVIVSQQISGGGQSSGGGSSSSGGGSKNSSALPAGVDAGFVPEKIAPLTDINEAEWAREAIEYCTEKKIVSGYEDKTFRPNNVIKREEFVTMLLRGAELFEAGHKSGFKDVIKDSWYEPYVACASQLGIINGISASEFGTGQTLTRQDMAVIVANTIDSSEKTIAEIREFKEFEDYGYVADYAKDAVKRLYTAGIINGVSEENFSGDTFVTRAQAVKVIYDAFCKE